MFYKRALKLIIFPLSVLLILYACNNRQQIIIDTISLVHKNTDSLKKIINLTMFEPDSVAYVYTVMGDADNNSRMPGPKDYDLEAVLFYSDYMINKLKGISSIKTIKELQPRDEMKYQFSWMDKKILKEISSLKNIVEYSSEKFYKGYLPHGSYIIVGNIVLLKMLTM